MNLSGKKILVTGADGFIGSHLTEDLLKQGYEVTALSYYNSFNNWGWLEDFEHPENLEIVSGDLRDAHFINGLCKGKEVIFHLGALIAIPYSYNAAQSYIDTNVHGTLNILEAARSQQCQKLVCVSTSEIYGTAQYVPIDEKHPKNPQSPYAASKVASDALAMSYYKSFEIPLVVARPFNTYGPRQSARAVIPTIITQINSGVKQIKLGNLRPTRDFNFVEDTCRGLISLAESDQVLGKEVNIASNFEVSIEDTFNTIRDILGMEVEIVGDEIRNRPENSEVFRLFGDNSLLYELTGYKPSTNFKEGLKHTCSWFSNPLNLSKYKSGIYNI